MKFESRRVDIADLDSGDRCRMFQLFERYFACANRTDFETDLSEKDWVILLMDSERGRLCGFSTQQLVSACCEGGPVKALFSGDTIVDLEYRFETALMREWGRLAMELAESTAPDPLYWFLISKGYRTYRFLPVFFREFFPRFDAETPAATNRIIDGLAGSLFADAYDPRRGLLMAWPSKNRLRPRYAGVSEHRRRDHHVRFFLDRNPDYRIGDELCCLARIHIDNFTPAALRLIDRIGSTSGLNRKGSQKTG
jgi:hypothetical protein